MSGTFSFSFCKSSKYENVLEYKTRVELVESHFKELAKLVEKYAKTTRKLGQRGASISDAVCSSFEDLEQKEVAMDVKKFGKCLTALQNEREQFASELSNRIAGDFRVYETKCSETKKEIDTCDHLIVKQHNEKEQLQKLQNKMPLNRRKVMEVKVRLEKAQVMSKNSNSLLQEQMDEFEKQKLHDSGRILREFVRMEMQFHARSLQIYTKAYQHLMNIPDANDNMVYRFSADEQTSEESSGRTSRGVVYVKSTNMEKQDSALSISDLC